MIQCIFACDFDNVTLATFLLLFSDASKNFSRFVAETEQILSFAKNWELPVDGFPAVYKKFFGTAIHGISGREQFTNGSANGTLEVSVIQLRAFLHLHLPLTHIHTYTYMTDVVGHVLCSYVVGSVLFSVAIAIIMV